MAIFGYCIFFIECVDPALAHRFHNLYLDIFLGLNMYYVILYMKLISFTYDQLGITYTQIVRRVFVTWLLITFNFAAHTSSCHLTCKARLLFVCLFVLLNRTF